MQNDFQSQGVPSAPGGYESRDANVFGILIFGALVLCTCIAAYFAAQALMKKFEERAENTDRIIAQTATVPAAASIQPYFPFPREQPSSPEEFKTFRARELTELNGYGWIDRKAGIVRLPINRAMELLLQRGLPERTVENQSDKGPSNLELQQKRDQNSTPTNSGTK